jgi:flagellar M-ring protein FliF
MDSKFTPAALPASDAAAPAVLGRLGALPLRNKIILAGATAMLAALAYVSVNMGRQPDWRPLYASMSDRDGGAVLAALDQMAIPHKFSDASGTFLVPADRVHEARLRLASQGLPKGGTVGFEIMEGQKFGVTQFQERLNFQRGLEGELARSIMALSAVQSARVHLALPAQTAFMREQQKPSASVLLTLYGGRTLDRSQIAGVVHLVASSVPDMPPAAVSVLDQTGALLSQNGPAAPNGLDAAQQQYVRQMEQSLSARILGILEPIVGAGNVRAQVTADVDFTQSESTAELFGPNQGASPAAVRSQQLSESSGSSSGNSTMSGGGGGGGLGGVAGGIPGALSNQPPSGSGAPINGGAQALSAGSGSTSNSGTRRDAVTNYEVDKTVRVVRNATGSIKRLSTAVIVNHASVKGADGKLTQVALPAAKLEQINALVREAIGFSKDRGDSLNVVNAPFTGTEPPPAPQVPMWRQPETVEIVRTAAPWIALPLVALIIILGLVRPAMRASRDRRPVQLVQTSVRDAISLPAPPGAMLPDGAGATDGSALPLLPSAQAQAQLQELRTLQLDNIRKQARENPGTVANVVRNWVNQPA